MGTSNIKKIITSVSASIELFEKAIKQKADTIIVHHGIIWNYERPVYKGSYRERVKILLDNNINLFAYHLPLDAHPVIGNNAQLAKLLGLKNRQPFGDHKGQSIGIQGKIAKTTKDKFFNKVEKLVERELLVFPFGPEKIKNVGIVSGGAQKEFAQAISENLDAYITGEVSEHIKYLSQEEKVHFISAGHYATERFGIIALGNHLKNKYKINVEFIDIPNPV
jgi:dinuclear metal center YbgI/SA1388 family protein